MGRRRGAPPKHGASAGKAAEKDPDTEDVAEAGAAARVTAGAFEPGRAQEIAVAGAAITAELSILLRKQSKHRKILAEVGEAIHTKTKDLCALWEDTKSGQQRLFDAAVADAPERNAPEPEADAHEARYKGKRLSIERTDEGWRPTVATGTDVAAVGEVVFPGREDAMDDALRMAGFNTKDERPKWKPVKTKAIGYVGPIKYWCEHGGKPLEASRTAEGAWESLVSEKVIGRFDDARAAMQFCLAEVGMQDSLRGIAQWDCTTLDAKGNMYSAPVTTDAVEPMNIEYGARVGKRACVIRQEDPGEWWARIGDVPIAQRLSLAKAKTLAERELRKGEGKDAVIEWLRTERAQARAAK